MYVGHALLGFVLAAWVARWLGVARDRALLVGLVGGAFAVVPDLDAARTVIAVIEAGPSNVFPTTEHVWTESWVVHRSLTHSLLTAAVAVALAVALADARRRRREGSVVGPPALVAAGAGALLLGTGALADGAVGAGTMAVYVAGLVAASALAARWRLAPRLVGVAAAVALVSHPFGDVFMGRPPAFLYPLVERASLETVVVASDPTVNLVALFGIELGLAWLVAWTWASCRGVRLRDRVDRTAALGAGFAASALVIRPPTLDVAYHWALGTLATGAVVGFGPRVATTRSRRAAVVRGEATALAAVTAAVASYLVAYVLVG